MKKLIAFFFCIAPLFSLAQQERAIHKNLNIDNHGDSRFYESCVLPNGWATVGRAVNRETGTTSALVYLQWKDGKEHLVILKGGINCRLYTVLADTDTSFVAAGYIQYAEGEPVRSFFSRWNSKGVLRDSASYSIGEGDFNLISDLQTDEQKNIYAWCRAGSRERGEPYLLQINPGLELAAEAKIPVGISNAGISGLFLYVPERREFIFSEYNDTTAIIGRLDKQGTLKESNPVYTLEGYKSAEDYLYNNYSDKKGVQAYALAWHQGDTYVSGVCEGNTWLGKLDSSLRLVQSHQLQSSLYEEGGDLHINDSGIWVSCISSHSSSKNTTQKLVRLDSQLVVKRILNTRGLALTLNLSPLGHDQVLLTGFTEASGTAQPAWSIISLKEKETGIKEARWTSLQGPLGADATSFTKDDRGNYWLGTGSSGGVYFSSNKGNSWKPVLKGLGAMHIPALLWQQDTLWARVDDMRLKEILAPQHPTPAYFYLAGRKPAWRWLNDKSRIRSIEKAIRYNDIRLFNQYQERFPLKRSEFTYTRLIQYYQGFGVDFGNTSFDLYMHEVSNRMGGFSEIDSTTKRLNASFPPDVFETGRNIDLDNNRMILLTKSGLYFSDNDGPLYPAPRKGLVATDVRLLRKRKNNDLIALVGTQEIWRFRQNEWTMVFSTNDHYKKHGKDKEDRGLDIPCFDIGADDEIVFPFGTDMWKIPVNDSAQLLLGHGNWLPGLDDSGEPVHVSFFGGTRIKDGTYLLIGVSSQSDNNFQLFSWNNKELKPVRDFKTPQFSFAYTDKTGQTWIAGDSIYLWNDTAAALSGTIYRIGAHFSSEMSSNSRGDVVMLIFGGFMRWDPQLKEWLPQMLEYKEQQKDEDIQYNSIAIDDNKQVYFGASPTYSVMCGYHILGYPAGVFTLQGDKAHSWFNDINNWIYALEVDNNGHLIVGTSGSGAIKAVAKRKSKRK